MQQAVALVMQTFPLVLTVVLALLALSFHWVHHLRVLLLLVAGALVLTAVLKAVFRVPRPCGATNCASVPCWGTDCQDSTSGWPSGHALLAGAVATYLLLVTYAQPGCPLVQGLATVLALSLLVGMPLSRTRAAQRWQLHPVGAVAPNGCHTPAQAVAGVLIGMVLGGCVWNVWGKQQDP